MAKFAVVILFTFIATLISAAPAPAAKADPYFLVDTPVVYPVAAALPAPVVYSDFISPYAFAYSALGYGYTYPYATVW